MCTAQRCARCMRTAQTGHLCREGIEACCLGLLALPQGCLPQLSLKASPCLLCAYPVHSNSLTNLRCSPLTV